VTGKRQSFHNDGGAALDQPSVLAVFPSAIERAAILDLAACHGWHMTVCAALAAAEKELALRQPALILYDRDTPGLEWQDAIELLAQSAQASPIILVSGVADDYLWQEVNHLGGYDVLTKPLNPEAVAQGVRLAWSFFRSGFRRRRALT
jgi:DNA-binding response OmpR family regulator